MCRLFITPVAALVTAFGLLIQPSASAASATWSGAAANGNLWSTSGNWSTSPVPGTGDTATFNAAAGASGTTIDLGSGVTVNTIAFATSNVAAYTIGAGPVNSQSLILNGSGSAGLSASATGGTNTNQITINAALTINNTQQWVFSNGANPWIINGNVTPNGTNGSTIQVKINGRGATFNGILADQVGGAKLQISGANANTATLTNPNNSFTGGLYFDNGNVSVNSIGMTGSNSAAGAGSDLLFGTNSGGGSLIYTGTGNTTDRLIKFNHGFHGATINQSGASGLLKWISNLDVSTVGGQTLTLSGSAAGTGEFAGVIADNGTTGSTKVKGATTASTSAVLYSVDRIAVGASISGTGITAGTTITAINSSTRTVTLSQAATLADAATVTIPGVINNTKVTKSGTGTWTLSGNNTYTGTTTVSQGSLIVNGGMKFLLTDFSANKVTGAGSATFNSTFTIDTSAVTVPIGAWTLVDTTTKTFGGTFSLTGFTGPVSNVYTKIVGNRTWTFNKSTGLLNLTSTALITAFGIPGSTGVINQSNKTIALTVPYTPWSLGGLASLAPTFTVNSGTCNRTSGSAPSPTFAASNPITYTVTDGPTVNNYAVTVTITPPSTACSMLTCEFGALGPATINEAAGTVMLSISPSQSVTSLAPTFTLSSNATISPSSGSARDFTNPVVYRVTAENGTTYKDYRVSFLTYNTWAHSGSLHIMTTPEGADLPNGVSVSNFPLLIRLNSSNFNFAQAQSDGSDIRFSTAAGYPLSYEIEHWDSINGQAAVWVKIPTISGNARQEIKMYWGKSGISSQSNGSHVFNASNGYCSVMHLNGNVQDSTGSTSPVNGGATPTTAVIGSTAMNLSTGDITASNITNFPSGTNPASTGEVWFRARKVFNFTMPLAWGNKDYYGWNTWKMHIGFWNSPTTVLPAPLTCRGPAKLSGSAALAAQQWYHLVYTNSGGNAKLYVNGVLDGTASGSSMTIANPQALAMTMAGGDGDVDEARISNVARSADWVKLQYENQKPLQTLVGGIVSAGSDFSVTPTSVTMNENSSTTLTAQAGGAQKVYWIYKKNGQETLLATDQLTFNYNVGRLTGNDSAVIQFKAVFANTTQTIEVPLTVLDTIPDPAFTLTPSTTTWDGRQTMTVTANITNLSAMQAAGFGSLTYNWSVSGVAVTKQASNGTLTLTRSQGSGPMTVSLTTSNGGIPVSASTNITVQEPVSDAWVQRTPDINEKPLNKQFFARDPNTGNGTIFYNGTQIGTPDTVYLKVYKTPSGGSESLHATHRQSLISGAYAFSATIPAGLVTYRVVYGTTTGGVDTDAATVNDLVCGDAFIIEGQSNALATDNTAPNDTTTTNKWIRTYGLTSGWGYAISKGNDLQLGLWGWYLSNRLVTNNNMPICIINGAVGGTRIDQHRPNPAGHGTAGSLYSIYANLYNRVVGAKLTHGIRGLFWHQGENSQGSAGPDGDYDYKFYQQYFVDISASWKQDFPNISNYYVFQIWPGACGDTSRNDQLREVLRNLPRLYSNMRMMSTLGITPGSSCHYEPAGYQVFSDLIGPLVEQDVYGDASPFPITAANLQRAYFTTEARNEIALVFDQEVAWNTGATTTFFLTDTNGTTSGSVTSGSATGNTIKLQVSGASTAATITYVKGLVTWSQSNLIYGANGIAALTFADVAIGPSTPAGVSATPAATSAVQISLAWTASTGATSYKVKRATVSGGPYTTIATTTVPTYTDLSCIGGTTYYYVVSAINTVGFSSNESLNSMQASATPLTEFRAWSTDPALGLTTGSNDGPSMDPDNDGVPNLLEFVLGTGPMNSSSAALPSLQPDIEQWVFEYDRNRASLPPATTQIVQYSNDLMIWNDIPVPTTSSGAVEVTPGVTSDHVQVTIPSSNPKTFVRLKTSQ
ncbi:MAG: DUF2341 domain-containing protein [Verrucomicrobiota bacterium]